CSNVCRWAACRSVSCMIRSAPFGTISLNRCRTSGGGSGPDHSLRDSEETTAVRCSSSRRERPWLRLFFEGLGILLVDYAAHIAAYSVPVRSHRFDGTGVRVANPI